MAIQFADYANIITNASNAGANMMNAKMNEAESLGRSITALGGSVGEIIRRQREKKAEDIMEDEINVRSNYNDNPELWDKIIANGGKFRDNSTNTDYEIDEKFLQRVKMARDLPESIQLLSLSAKLGPYSKDQSKNIFAAALKARDLENQKELQKDKFEQEVLLAGGDPRIIRLQKERESLQKQERDIWERMKGVGKDISSTAFARQNAAYLIEIKNALDRNREAISKALYGEAAPAATSIPKTTEPAEVGNEEPKDRDPSTPVDFGADLDQLSGLILRMNSARNEEEVQAIVDEISNGDYSPVVKSIAVSAGENRVSDLLGIGKKKFDLEKGEFDIAKGKRDEERKDEELEMKKRAEEWSNAKEVWAPYRDTAKNLQIAVWSLSGILSGLPTPENFDTARSNLNQIGAALKRIEAGAGDYETEVASLLAPLQTLAGKHKITAEAYNRQIRNVVNQIGNIVEKFNGKITKEIGDDEGVKKTLGEQMLIDESPSTWKWGEASKDYSDGLIKGRDPKDPEVPAGPIVPNDPGNPPKITYGDE